MPRLFQQLQSRRNKRIRRKSDSKQRRNNNNMKFSFASFSSRLLAPYRTGLPNYYGLHQKGMNLTISPDVLSHVSAESLNYLELYDAFHIILFNQPNKPKHYTELPQPSSETSSKTSPEASTMSSDRTTTSVSS
eukprot:TRINITY_DN7150_c0_g9_i2.p2 TRINITY_DN7150_c0_g9~~TRINITY_DN7150_c0_g9_i2.p2  ORF type:complete len:134 (-),score=1.53 TRINITY_DN7150_c0_g9_i2:374-775(-)